MSTVHLDILGMIHDFRWIAAIDSYQLSTIHALYALHMK